MDRSKAAALFVDLQEEHRQDQRYLVEGFEAVLGHVQKLQQAARDAEVPVYHSAYVVDLDAHAHKPFHPVMPDGTSAFSDVSNPLSAICPEVGPAGDEIVLVKTDASAFAQGDVALLLRSRGVEWVVIAGVWTEACIAATVNDAIRLGFRVILVKDACGSATQAMHQTAILNLANRLYGGCVVDTDAAARLLAGATVEAWMVQGSVPIRFTLDNAGELYGQL
ncbi:MAG: isochorismatase family protein [Alphaproteobacteria bacterium]